MKYDFDTPQDRTNTGSMKHSFSERIYGLNGVIPMWVADMDFAVPEPIIEAIRKRADHPVFGYTEIPDSLWEAVMSWLRARFGWETRPSWFALAPGVVPSINLCIQAFSNPGDEVIIQTPVYHPFFQAVERNGRNLVRNPLKRVNGRYFMDFEDLERKIGERTRLLILCSPHNPVGRVWTRDELGRLADICIRHDLLVVSDEIHSDLVFRGHAHTPLAAITEAISERTVTCTSASKTFNFAGLTISYVVASRPDLLARVQEVTARSLSLFQGNIFGLAALEAAYRHGAEWLEQLLSYLEETMDFVERLVVARMPDLGFVRPEGTFLALLDCRKLGLDQTALMDFFLRRASVLFSDGTMFGPELRGYVRMNLGCSRRVVGQAMERIERALRART
jgi:cystathionine beta-lyase